MIIEDIHNRKYAERILSEFNTVISHQFQAPLSVINMSTELLLKDFKEGGDKDLIQKIATSNSKLQMLIDGILAISKLESGNVKIKQTSVDVTELIEETMKEIEHWAQEKGCKVLFHKPAQLLSKIPCDPILIRQVIHNYLVNSIYYSEKESSDVEITLKKNGQEYEVCVLDHGIGIPEEEKVHIFQKFFRATNAQKKRPNGTGMGLYTTKLMIEVSGGKVWFETSTEGEEKGTKFFFSLPINGVKKG